MSACATRSDRRPHAADRRRPRLPPGAGVDHRRQRHHADLRRHHVPVRHRPRARLRLDAERGRAHLALHGDLHHSGADRLVVPPPPSRSQLPISRRRAVRDDMLWPLALPATCRTTRSSTSCAWRRSPRSCPRCSSLGSVVQLRHAGAEPRHRLHRRHADRGLHARNPAARRPALRGGAVRRGGCAGAGHRRRQRGDGALPPQGRHRDGRGRGALGQAEGGFPRPADQARRHGRGQGLGRAVPRGLSGAGRRDRPDAGLHLVPLRPAAGHGRGGGRVPRRAAHARHPLGAADRVLHGEHRRVSSPSSAIR